jgi:hypothetical protein
MGKEKLLVPKFDSLHKHVAKKKVTSLVSNVPKGMLKIVNMLRTKCFIFPKVGKVCSIGFGYENMNGLL